MNLLVWLTASLMLDYAHPAAAEPIEAAGIGGWQEAVLTVSDIDAWVELWEEEGGWEVRAAEPLSPTQLWQWKLPVGASGRSVVIGNRGADSGFIRLVEFRGVEQRQMRSTAQSWETGGWFDINTRAVDLDATFSRLQARGWTGFADPVRIEFGPFIVNEWLGQGPDGIVIAMIERIEPPLEGWPNLQKLSRSFNATQVVADMESVFDFYTQVLGFEVYLENKGPSQEPGPNVLGLPHNLAAQISREVYIVHPEGTNEGSVELLAFEGATGRDFSEHTRTPNLGILSLRFPVTNLTVLLCHLERNEATFVARPARHRTQPWGEVDSLVIAGPNGEWLEFFMPAGEVPTPSSCN